MIYFPNEPVDIATIAAGDNNIGNVDIASIAAGDNNIGNVDLASSIPAGTNNIGDVDVASIAAGDNNIGNVDLASSIPAGTNNIGDVDVASIAAGTNTIGKIYLTDGSEDVDVVTNVDEDTNLDGTNGIVGASVLYGRIDEDNIKPLVIDKSTHALQTVDHTIAEINAGAHYYLQGYTTLQDTDTLYVKLVTPDTAKWVRFLYVVNSTGILTTTFDEDATGGMAGGLRPTIHANNRNLNCWTGAHTGADNAAVLTDSGQAWTPDALIGMTVFNSTDQSSGVITDNDATTVTATLAGGTGNDWDTGDTYEINGTALIITSGVAIATSYTQRLENDSWGADGFKETIGGGGGREDELVLKQNTTYLRSFTSGADNNIVQFKASWHEHTDKT